MSDTMGSLNVSLAEKLAGKFDPQLEKKLLVWIADKLNDSELQKDAPLQETLKDGTVLCRYVGYS